MFYDDYNQPHPRHLTFVVKNNIELINWGGLNIDVHQMLYSYDQKTKRTEGLLITTFDFSAHERRKHKNRYKGELYIKARTHLGLWEATMLNVHIKEMGRQCYWFRYDAPMNHHILEKPKT